MNWEQIEGKWKQMQGSIKQQWGKLTDDDLEVIAGHRDKLIGKLQERYGLAKEAAEREVDLWNVPATAETTQEHKRRIA